MRPLPLLVLLLTLLFASAPFWSGTFAGFEAAAFPIPQAEQPAEPPGPFFAVWSLIYAGLVLSAVFGVWKRPDDAGWDRARVPLAVSLAVGVPWLLVAQRSAEAATLMIVIMAMTAIWALRAAPGRDRWWLEALVGLYAGWLTAATWVSVAALGAGYGLFGLGSLGWAFLGVLGALLVAVPVVLARASFGYVATASWALLGIAAKNAGAYPGLAALAAAGIVALLAVWWARRDRVTVGATA